MIRIITIEREFGSGAGVIAEKVAQRLGWKLWDQLLTDEIARRMDCERRVVEEHEERRDPVYYRLFRAFMRGSFEGSLNAPRLRMVDTDCVREVVQQILMEEAEAGNCVIVGRGSAYYLGGRRDAFHVFIYAPFEDKVRRLQSMGKSEKEAIELAKTVDVDRAAFIKKYFNVDWPEIYRFHQMINSSIGEDVAVDIIVDTVAHVSRQRA
jgi:cytidylate kinase